MKDLAGALRHVVSSMDPSRLRPAEAAELVDLFAESERPCAAERTLAAGRVAEWSEWRASGHRTAAQWIASRTQGAVGQAIATLQTAYHLNKLPETRDAFASGRLSELQAAEITAAAAADPGSEPALLALAQEETLATLREQCRQVRAAASGDEDVAERIRRGRYLRNWIERDGAVRLDARLAPDDEARLLAVVKADAARLQQEAKRSGQHEPAEAHAADALVALAGRGVAPQAVVHVQVDASAFDRGKTWPGETCQPGLGPIPVATARRLAGNGVVKVIERKGVEVSRVAHLGRTIPAHLRTALEARDPVCVVPGCDVLRASRSTTSCRSPTADPRSSTISPGCAVSTMQRRRTRMAPRGITRRLDLETRRGEGPPAGRDLAGAPRHPDHFPTIFGERTFVEVAVERLHREARAR